MTPTAMPTATVRLQIHAGFDLDAAAAVVPYYAALGISHFYVSPLQQAKSGSLHGYDGIDPTRIDPARGGRAALRRLVAALRAHGMGLVLDIVPNHLSSSLENPWWVDVLEHGRASRHARFFDIDWDPPDARLRNRVLAPFLAEPPVALLERGELRLAWDEGVGRLGFAVGGQLYPLGAACYAPLLARVAPRLAPLFADASAGEAFVQARARLAETLAAPEARAAFASGLARLNGDRVALQGRLDAQPYELADWREASRRINWRRFFDIGDLVALRMEDRAVFDAFHALVFELYAAGEIDGVRIDHVDGLADPPTYLRWLREGLAEREAMRPAAAPRGPAWILVEKILAADEALPTGWPVDGTTGYEFMDQVSALLHDADGERELDAAWTAVGGEPWQAIASAARAEVLASAFEADLSRLLRRIAAALPDADPGALRSALRALLLHYPRYRGYARAGRPDPADAPALAAALSGARGEADVDAEVLEPLVSLLSGLVPAGDAAADAAITGFQQLTAPLAARALEDTAFYRYGRLLSRNEVGADPAQLALPAAAFHRRCGERARQWPRTLLATASHDHKRGEDARMRIATLGDDPAAWRERIAAWVLPDPRAAPDAIDRSMACQALVGSWPPGGAADVDAAWRERLAAWQAKATRERKQHGSWLAPDPGYEEAAAAWLAGRLHDGAFLAAMDATVADGARAAAVRSLAQVTLRCTTPGIPDLYQGTEWLDTSLVDPDNRRDVDYDSRRAALAAGGAAQSPWHAAHPKQQLLARLLQMRRNDPALFAGDYQPIALDGALAGCFLAFRRSAGSRHLLVLVPIRPRGLFDAALRLQATCAEGTRVRLGFDGRGADAFSGEPRDLQSAMPVAALLRDGPVAVVRFDTAGPAAPPAA
jgi:(1->4)-alpha-D-glucan 1-alpha-D-glucosylmutase